MTISLSNRVLLRRSLGALLSVLMVVGALAAVSIRADKAQAGEFANFGVTIAGGNGYGAGATQLAAPHGLAIDSAGKPKRQFSGDH